MKTLQKMVDVGGVGVRAKVGTELMRFLEGSEMEKFGTGKGKRRERVEVERLDRQGQGGGERVMRVFRVRIERRKKKKKIWEE